MTPEGKVRSYLRKRILATGGEHRKVGWIGRHSAPDELAWWPETKAFLEDGRHAFVEVKRPGEKPTGAQAREHARMRMGGFRVEVVDTIAGVDELIKRLTGYGPSEHAQASEKE